MWIFTKEGFFSAVISPEYCKEGEVAVRARNRDDLHRLIDCLDVQGCTTQIIDTPQADYCSRVIIPKAFWVQYVATAADGIDYDNFKKATTADDDLRHTAYFGCWSSLYNWQHLLMEKRS